MIAFIARKGVLSQQNLEKKLFIDKHELLCYNNYTQFLKVQLGEGKPYNDWEKRLVDEIGNKEKIIKMKEKEIEAYQKEVTAKEKIVKDNEIEWIKT